MNYTSNKKPLTDTQKKSIIRLRECGHSFGEIAKIVDSGFHTVRVFLISQGMGKHLRDKKL